MADFTLTVATPDRQLVNERTSEAAIPARNGYIGVLPGHAPLLSELGSGVMTWVQGGQTRRMAVMGGFVEVRGDIVRVLADEARPKEEIDLGKARERLSQAQQALSKPPMDDPQPSDWEALVEDISKAQAEIDTASK
jgi:F-type H+-transporting ATPase subunit epsilon